MRKVQKTTLEGLYPKKDHFLACKVYFTSARENVFAFAVFGCLTICIKNCRKTLEQIFEKNLLRINFLNA